MTTERIIQRLGDAIINPLISLIFALALLYFVWGIVKFIAGAENPEKRKEGTRHMIWGILGMFIMVAAWGILAFIKSSIGV